MSTQIVMVVLAVVSAVSLGLAVRALLRDYDLPAFLRWRAPKEREGGVTVDYLSQSGRRSELKLDPEDLQSIERFLESVRRAEEPRGSHGEPTAAR
jgi:hypothetical protein